MPLVVNVRGANGSGKTTLVRALVEGTPAYRLMPDVWAHDVDAGEDGKLTAIGRYDGPVSGGCDGVKRQDLVRDAILTALYRNASLVVFESVIISTLFGKWSAFSKHILAPQFGLGMTWLYLTTPLDVCLKRIQLRNGGKPIREELVAAKVRAIASTRAKARREGERVVDLASGWASPADARAKFANAVGIELPAPPTPSLGDLCL